ncbi:OmpA/MotB domain protein [Bosea sp. LC85]|uniref:OmpA family protein n=1 Tax=Bosea sp. LC85 TaxID=1502851 RepID=UPI0004E34D6B|nr:OmpA family protein [Bosea sp. LC85]KFC69575.1 OmpA/MotB domain protein [Bosea sp. LC85]
MAQPANWLWGLVPLALLWSAGNLYLDAAVQDDVSRRAIAVATQAAGEAPGARPVMALVAGRDVLIGGEALSADGAAKAMVQLRGQFGIRRALGGLSQVVAQKPYSWSATRERDAVTLSGFVPDEATATANVSAASAAVPGLRIDDRQMLAFGAPAGFAAVTQKILGELAGLSSGKVALDDTRFCIEGKATTPERFLALRESTASLSQGGFTAVECALEPPTIAPYRWAIEKGVDGGLSVTGFYPSDEARQQISAALRRGFPEPARIDDQTKPALGEPGAFLAKVTRAIGDLARLRSGKAELDAGTYRLSGDGPEDFETCQALQLLIAQTDGPDSVAQASIACPPAPPPMPPLPEIPPLFVPAEPPAPLEPSTPPAPQRGELPSPGSSHASAGEVKAPIPVLAVPQRTVPLQWRAEKTEQGAVLSGLVPDEAARQRVLHSADRGAAAGRVTDRMTGEAKLREAPDFGTATGFLLDLLGRMSSGVVSIEGTQASLSGVVADEEAWRAIEAALRQQPLPGGLTGTPDLAGLGLRPYGLTISADRSGVALSGYLPDEQTRSALLGLLDGSPLQGKVLDEARIVPGAPAGFSGAARVAVTDLLRLDLGTAHLVDSSVELRGLTCRELIKGEVETSAASGLPAAFAGQAEIGLRQTGCVTAPPNACQNELDALTRRQSVLFGQGTAVVVLDATTERAMAEASAILKQCPDVRVTIEGHANFDGERRGFDNVDLSNRRARRVLDEMVMRGISAARLEPKGFGAQRPLVPHDEPEAKAMNRRVQFTVEK